MQSGSYKDLEICRGDQERHIVEGGLQRSETKQGTVTEKKKRHQGTRAEGEEVSFNLVHIKND